jgi:hypothetical protein
VSRASALASPRPGPLLAAALLLLAVLVSCNAILDNRPGRLRQSKIDCSEGKKVCLGTCVDALDPGFGCLPGTCDACNLPKTSGYKCDGAGCAVAQCFTAYFSCDGKNPNGCETDLRKPADCGSCGNACPGDRSWCDSSRSPAVECVVDCDETRSTRCAATRQCVNAKTDIANCGECGKECVPPPGGLPTCLDGRCGFACNASLGFRACTSKGTCERESIESCGPSCTKCTVRDPSLYEPACVNGGCEERCKFPICNGRCAPPPCNSSCVFPVADCDGNGSCEANLQTTQTCGACDRTCSAGPNQTAQCVPDVNGYICSYACDSGYQECDPMAPGCESLGANPNCGMCGRDCHASCNAGSCGTDCQGGWADCDGDPANGCETFGVCLPGSDAGTDAAPSDASMDACPDGGPTAGDGGALPGPPAPCL